MVEPLKTREGRHIGAGAAPAHHPEAITLRFGGAVVGTIVGLADDGVPLVDFPANPSMRHLKARTCVEVGAVDVGKSVVLQFDAGDPQSPIVIGVIQWPASTQAKSVPNGKHMVVETDGSEVAVVASESLTLRCGNASITLTADGKVTIKGAQVHSRSSGVNRIQGASVRIN